jgi:hypothetical protein
MSKENTNQDPTSGIPSTVFDQLLEPVDEFVQKPDRELPQHPNQKFRYYDFFRLLMYFLVSGGKSLKLFLNTDLNQGLLPTTLRLRPVAYTTFGEAFERFGVMNFQAVFQHLLKTVPFKPIPELAALGTLYCIDGSRFPVINSMLWAEYTSKHQALKLHLGFELNRMLPVEFLITAANFRERQALVKMLKAGITYIADRGYMSFRICHEVSNARAYFVFRVKAGLRFTVKKTLPVQLPKMLPNVFNNVTDELIRYTNDQFKHTYRLVCFSIGSDTFYLLTNRRFLTTFQVIILYAYRWQIELLFRFLKRTMKGIHLIKQDQRGVTIQFYALLIVAMLELRLKPKIADQNNCKDKKSSDKIKKGEKSRASKSCRCSKSESEKFQSYGYKFIETIGKNLNKYWKIGIHWLTTLQRLLAKPFNQQFPLIQKI